MMQMPKGRLVGRLLCFVALVATVWAAGPQMTQVQDVMYRADGAPATGALVITWPAFVTADGAAVAAGSTTVKLGSDGSFRAALAPNAGALPAGSYYSVTVKLDSGATSKEAWLVPSSSPATLAAVRAQVAPANMAVQALTSDWANANLVSLNAAQSIGGAKSFATSPTVPDPVNATDAANKEYVDQNAAGGPNVAKVNVAQTWSQAQTFQVSNGRANEQAFAGPDLATRVQNACNQVVGSQGAYVQIPATETDKSFALPAKMREGCIVVDERGQFYMGANGSYQYTSGAAAGEGTTEWMQVNTAAPTCCTHKFLHQWMLEANSGGYNNWNGVSGTKTDYATFGVGMVRRTPGQGEVIELGQNNYSTLGDVVGIAYNLQTNAANVAGDEGVDIMSGMATAGLPAFKGTVASINSGTVTLTPTANAQNIGELNFLLNTSRGTYSAGTASIAGTPPVITGTGTSWSTLCPGGTAPCSPTDLYFEFTGEAGIAAAQTHVVMPIATISSDTSATLTLQAYGANISYTGSATGSAAYKIYRGATVTAVPYNSNNWSTVYATLSSTADFQAGDSVMDVGGAFSHLSGIRIQQTQNLPYPGNGGSGMLGVTVNGPYPVQVGMTVSAAGTSPAGYSYALMNADWGMTSTTPLYGMRLNGVSPNYGFVFAQDPAGNNLESLLCTYNSANYSKCLQFDRTSGNNFWQVGDLKWTSDGTSRMEIGGSAPQANLQLFQYISAANAPTYTARQVNYYANPNNGVFLDRVDIGGVPVWGLQSAGSGKANEVINNGNSLIFDAQNQSGTTASISAATGVAQFAAVKSGTSANSDMAGQIAIASGTSGTYTFTKTWASAPICTLTPTGDPTAAGAYWVSTNTTTLTVTTKNAATLTFNYTCVGRT